MQWHATALPVADFVSLLLGVVAVVASVGAARNRLESHNTVPATTAVSGVSFITYSLLSLQWEFATVAVEVVLKLSRAMACDGITSS